MELAGASSSTPIMIAHSMKELYERVLPFFTQAILLDRAFAHCPRSLQNLPHVLPSHLFLAKKRECFEVAYWEWTGQQLPTLTVIPLRFRWRVPVAPYLATLVADTSP
ncbi:hypothetical protein V6N11_082401 [Hibiscus sabdariffa]|uniref:Uncharacterized protein n=1 Tax=Hibiscus sabdariffa TaxID=183260 RepID=A0ABR2PCS0_9ROSI